MRFTSPFASLTLALVVLVPAAAAQDTRPASPPPTPAPGSPPAVPAIRSGPAAVDPATDAVLKSIRKAVAPSEAQMDKIVERYRQFRQEQWGAIREILNARRKDARPPVPLPGSTDDGANAAEAAYRARLEEAQKEVQGRFIADCRAMLDDGQLEAWDACIARLDLRPGAARPRPINPWLDPERGPKVDDEAPGFELKDLDDQPVSLASLRGRPVVIEFGSYTSPIFRFRVKEMKRLQKAFGDQVHWILVYTLEEHPEGGPVSRRNELDNVKLPQPKTYEERVATARLARDKLELTMRVLVDGLDDRVTKTYSGHPNRGYVLDAEGRVAARQVWINPRQVETTLRELLPKPDPAALPRSVDR